MSILVAESIHKTYGDKVLFNNVTFGVEQSDKIGLIGVNGTGKSTLLKILAGLDVLDEGKIIKGNGIKVEYLPQNPSFHDDKTVIQQVFKGASPLLRLISDYEYTLDKVSFYPENKDWQNRLLQLSQKMDEMGAWQLESEAKNILTQLGITDFDAKVGNLSGGQRKRIALASALINEADLLILDEPTNHIDNETVVWLEQYLHTYKGALIMVTHDRYFLDRVTSKIIELDKGNLYSYLGNYSMFLELKAGREEQFLASEDKRQNLLRNELEWMKRGAKARTTKQKARIQRFHQLQDEKVDLSNDKVEINIVASRLGKKVVELEDISKAYGDKTLIKDFSYNFLRDDRVGIVGPNGSGKSSLLNIIVGKILPDKGKVHLGETVKVGYFSQESADMDESLRVIDYIKNEAEYLPTADGGTITAAKMLEKFLFSPNAQWTPIAKLSGGERRRLYLLKILMANPNILILDEPTNDLDIQTLTILEDYLDDFAGAVITVSHDRYFLDRSLEKLFVFEGDGVIKQFLGSYSEYQENAKIKARDLIDNKRTVQAKNINADVSQQAKTLKFTFKEEKEYNEIDNVIAEVEEELDQVNNGIIQGGSDFSLLQELVAKKQDLEQKLDGLLERWTYLNELAEEIEKNKHTKKGI